MAIPFRFKLSQKYKMIDLALKLYSVTAKESSAMKIMNGCSGRKERKVVEVKNQAFTLPIKWLSQRIFLGKNFATVKAQSTG